MSAGSDLERLVPEWLTVPEVAQRLGIDANRARQFVQEGKLAAARRGPGGVLQVPAAFVDGDKPLKGLAGALTILADNRYTPEEAIRWLFTPDDSLPGTPVQALAENRGTEVKRRAQALGF